MSVAAVILAGGAGRRFNAAGETHEPGAKLLATLHGDSVITWALRPALAAGFDEVVVVDGAADLSAVVPTGVTLIHNDAWSSGQASTLRTGVDWCQQRGHDAAVIGLGDAPGLSVHAWSAVRDAPGGPMVFASYDGRRGHPVRLDARVWPLLATSGDEGARSVAREHPEWVSEVACEGRPGDIDVPEDLERWR